MAVRLAKAWLVQVVVWPPCLAAAAAAAAVAAECQHGDCESSDHPSLLQLGPPPMRIRSTLGADPDPGSNGSGVRDNVTDWLSNHSNETEQDLLDWLSNRSNGSNISDIFDEVKDVVRHDPSKASVQSLLNTLTTWLQGNQQLTEKQSCMLCSSSCDLNDPECACCAKVFDGAVQVVVPAGANLKTFRVNDINNRVKLSYYLGSEAMLEPDLARKVRELTVSAQTREDFAGSLRSQGIYSESQMASVDTIAAVAGASATGAESNKLRTATNADRATALKKLDERADVGVLAKKKLEGQTKEEEAEAQNAKDKKDKENEAKDKAMKEQLDIATAERKRAEKEMQDLVKIQEDLVKNGKDGMDARTLALSAKLQANIDGLKLKEADLRMDEAKASADAYQTSAGSVSGRELTTRELILKNGLLNGVILSNDIDATNLEQVVEFKSGIQQLSDEELALRVQFHPSIPTTDAAMEATDATSMSSANRVIQSLGTSSFEARTRTGGVGFAAKIPGVLSFGLGGAVASSSSGGSSSQDDSEQTKSFQNTTKSYFKAQYYFEPRSLLSVTPDMLQATPSFRAAVASLQVSIQNMSQPISTTNVPGGPVNLPGSACTENANCTFGTCNQESTGNLQCYESCDAEDSTRYATYWCNTPATPAMGMQGHLGVASGPAVGDTSRANCPLGMALTGCTCFSPGGLCNGAAVDGNTCVAYNGLLGTGVYAQPICVSVPMSHGWQNAQSNVSGSDLTHNFSGSDFTATVSCNASTVLTGCFCLPADPAGGASCEGATSQGNDCTASGPSVFAVARCAEIPSSRAWVQLSGPGAGGPSSSDAVSCPAGTMLTGCTCSSSKAGGCAGALASDGGTCTAYSYAGTSVQALAVCGWFPSAVDLSGAAMILGLFTQFGTHVCSRALLGGWWRIQASVLTMDESSTNDLSKVAAYATQEARSKGSTANFGGSAAFDFEGIPIKAASDISAAAASASNKTQEKAGAASDKLAEAMYKSNVNVQQTWNGGTSGVPAGQWRESLDESKNSNWLTIDRYASSCTGIWNFVHDATLKKQMCQTWLYSYSTDWPVALEEQASMLCERSAGDALFREMQQTVNQKQVQQAQDANKLSCESEAGMHWDDTVGRCMKNQCTCSAAAGATGASCVTHGSEKCNPSQLAKCNTLSCPTGYSLNPAMVNNYCASMTCDPSKQQDLAACCIDDRLAVNIKLVVKTKDEKNCGTKRNKIYAQLFGTSGLQTSKTQLDNPSGKDFLQGEQSEFTVKSSKPLIPTQICLTLEKARAIDNPWCPQFVQVYNADTNTLIGTAINWPSYSGGNQQECKPIMVQPTSF